MRKFYVYILFNHSRTLYVGTTNDLIRRVDEHRAGTVPGFTAKYRIKQLAYYESFSTAMQAIRREKEIKGWTRVKKIALIEQMNPGWEDLGNHLRERWPVDGVGEKVAKDGGPGSAGQVLRCAQEDGPRGGGADSARGGGPGAPGQVLRCAQDDGFSAVDGKQLH